MPSAGSSNSRTETVFVSEPSRQTPVREDVDVLVVGGGAAGLAAAVSAARNGAEVLLVERCGFLGGTLTNVTLGSICGMYTVDGGNNIVQVARGFVSELVERLQTAGGANGPLRWLETASMPYDAPTLRLLADEMVAECGVRIAFHATAVGVAKDEGRVSLVIFEDRAGRWAARAHTVIDCTGNGDIAAHAGAAFEYDPAILQAPTTMFRFAGVDTGRAATITRAELHACLERAVDAGLKLPRTAGGMFSPRPGVMHLNITRVSRDDPPDLMDAGDLAWAEMEGRRQLAIYQQAFRRFVPGFETCYIADIGAEIGIRESRRVRGDYWLELDDVLNEARFDDAIACSAWPVEEHAAGRATRWVFLKPGTYYQLPFRMMLPGGVEGLLVAGRCASASHDAHASMRVAATCMALGEAAGVAAAFASREQIALRQIDIRAVQARLLEQGAFLGVPYN